jgi:hypothetical protein
MHQQGYLSENVATFVAAAGASAATSAVASKIYDLSKLGARGFRLVTSILTIASGNYLEIRGTNTVPSDGTEANGVWTGSTAISIGAGIANSKLQGAANGDLLIADVKNFPYRFVQFLITRGTSSATEMMLLELYNNNSVPVTDVSTNVIEKANAPVVGTI